jgi:hypothetical protein
VFNFTVACVLTKILHLIIFMDQSFLCNLPLYLSFWDDAMLVVSRSMSRLLRQRASCLNVMMLRRKSIKTCASFVTTLRRCLALTMRVGTLWNLQQHLRSYQEVKLVILIRYFWLICKCILICSAVHFMYHSHPCDGLSCLFQMFPEDVISKLLSDADKYDAKINKVACLRTYSQVASAHRVRAFKRNELGRLVKKAKKVYQAELVEVICL